MLPECQFVCDAGFFDTNGDEADGCECEFLSSVDDPFDGIDADCDGQDGLPVDAVYVSETLGSVGATGTIDDPIAELQDGIDLAASIGAQYVVATLGDYQGPVDLIDGISVYGGYDFAFEFFDPDTYVSTIEGTIDGPVVSAVGIVNTTNFQGFDIIATAPTTNGGSAIGIWVEDSDEDFVLAKNVVIAGAGWRGDDGASGGDGLEGADGREGEDGDYAQCFLPLADGGDGGQNTCTAGSTDGGDGGDQDCPSVQEFQPSGGDGDGTLGGDGGSGSCDSVYYFYDFNIGCVCSVDPGCYDNAEDGERGGDGSDGDGGLGSNQLAGTFDALASGGWRAGDGTDGGVGGAGGGGGGGGTGSGTEMFDNCAQDNMAGGTGGGGGAGGCGGGSGGAGDGVGASLALDVHYTSASTTLPSISTTYCPRQVAMVA